MELKMNINFGEFIYQTLKLLPEKYLFAHAQTNMEVKFFFWRLDIFGDKISRKYEKN